MEENRAFVGIVDWFLLSCVKVFKILGFLFLLIARLLLSE